MFSFSYAPPSDSACSFHMHRSGLDMTCLDCIVITGYPLAEGHAIVGQPALSDHTRTSHFPVLPTSPTSTPPSIIPTFSFAPVTSTAPIASMIPEGLTMFDIPVGSDLIHLTDDQKYMLKMRNAMKEMNEVYDFVHGGQFLDLGCCPGGFSTYILENYSSARGVGVSLPPGDYVHSLAVPMELQDRLEVHLADLTMFNLAPQLLKGVRNISMFKPNPIQPQFFDFVMADGHQPSCIVDDLRPSWSKDRLLLSQLLITLRAVKPAGTLLVKLSLQIYVPLMERIVLALNRLSLTPVQAIKPTSIYATAATFYILARDLDADKCSVLAKKLEGLWYFLTFNGPDGFGRRLNKNEMDQIATYHDVLNEREQLKALFDPIEEVQKAAIAAGSAPMVPN